MAKIDVLLERVEHIVERIEKIEGHLKTQNGNVAKNSQFRIRSYAIFSLLSFALVIIGVFLR